MHSATVENPSGVWTAMHIPSSPHTIRHCALFAWIDDHMIYEKEIPHGLIVSKDPQFELGAVTKLCVDSELLFVIQIKIR